MFDLSNFGHVLANYADSRLGGTGLVNDAYNNATSPSSPFTNQLDQWGNPLQQQGTDHWGTPLPQGTQTDADGNVIPMNNIAQAQTSKSSPPITTGSSGIKGILGMAFPMLGQVFAKHDQDQMRQWQMANQ